MSIETWKLEHHAMCMGDGSTHVMVEVEEGSRFVRLEIGEREVLCMSRSEARDLISIIESAIESKLLSDAEAAHTFRMTGGWPQVQETFPPHGDGDDA